MSAPFLDFGPLLRQVELLQASVEFYPEWGRDEAAHLLTSVQQVQAVLASVEFSAEVLVRNAERDLHGPQRGLRQERMKRLLTDLDGGAA